MLYIEHKEWLGNYFDWAMNTLSVINFRYIYIMINITYIQYMCFKSPLKMCPQILKKEPVLFSHFIINITQYTF